MKWIIGTVVVVIAGIVFVVVMTNIETSKAREEQRQINDSVTDWQDVFNDD